jgi:hypothetical protein
MSKGSESGIFGEPTWFCEVNPNLDPTLEVGYGGQGSRYIILCEKDRAKGSHRMLKISISHAVIILALEPDPVLNKKVKV